MMENKGFMALMGFLCIFCDIIFLITFSVPFVSLGTRLIFILLFAGSAVLFFYLYYLDDKHEKDGTNARLIQREREEAIKSQTNSAPWERYYTYPCPFCGHYKVRDANWDDKRVSVAFWGVASSKIGDHYKCEHCNRTWK